MLLVEGRQGAFEYACLHLKRHLTEYFQRNASGEIYSL